MNREQAIQRVAKAWKNWNGSPEEQRDFDELSEAIRSLTALRSEQVVEPVALWQYRWLNPSKDFGPPSMMEWKEINDMATGQSLKNKIKEILSYNSMDGGPFYEVRALYTHPPQPELPTDRMKAIIEAGEQMTLAVGALKNFVQNLRGEDRRGNFTLHQLNAMSANWNRAKATINTEPK